MQPKTTSIHETIPSIIIYNPNSPNIFLIIKQTFGYIQYSKTIYNIFQKKSQTSNVSKLLCRC